ncbi:hypothetical protein F511_26837 [Dorcoceras hygrometricum]|uniref:Uncharacterized protein n=1 Tax=Dorcoceras hygrometricum TaxID=472368 RepID=A0A2Z7C0K0_9LAMI|nr:hypothetical protein F511_26837 [Dorcoceras hygrometricum]
MLLLRFSFFLYLFFIADRHLIWLLLLLSSTTDQTSHFRMRPVLFPPKRSNEKDSLLCIDFSIRLHQTSLYATQLTASTAGISHPSLPSIATVESEKLRQFTDGLRPDIRHDVNMVDVETYMAAVNRAYRSERGRKDMREDYQRKTQMQQPARGQSSQPPAKRPFQWPSKGPSQ